MNLKIQLLSLIFSFVYGIFFSLLLKFNNKILFFSNYFIKIVSNFLFMLDVALCYFLIIKYINNGILHIYFLILFFGGWLFGNFVLDRFLKK